MAAPPPMGSTTDDSDWNRPSYPRLKPANPHFHNLDQPKKEIRFSPQRNLTPQHPPKKSVKPRAAPRPQESQFAVSPAIPLLHVLSTPDATAVAAPAPLPTTPNVTSAPAVSLSAPTTTITPAIATSQPASETPVNAGPSWEAARESILDQMVTTQDISTPTTVPQTKRPKTGGRRGRGGRPAGGRPPKIKLETPVNIPTVAGDASTPSGSGRGRGSRKGTNIGRGRGFGGGRPRGSRAGTSAARGMGRGSVKRKREDEDEGDKDDTDVSETYMPLPTQSRSGRKISKIAGVTPVSRTVIDLEAITVETPTAPPKIAEKVSSGKKEKGKKRYKKPGEASVCKNCGRGHSPMSNVIVFCDGCNKPWHQHCHDPPIPWDVVRIEEQEWYCADCEVLREERVHLEGKVSAEGMSLVEKRNYFQSLPAAHLISLLLHASTLHPTLPIFSPLKTATNPFPPPTQPHPITTTSISTQLPHQLQPDLPFPPRSTNPRVTAEEDETYYELPSDYDPLPYPKPGNGVALPPEEEDLHLLVDEDVVVFSRVGREKGADLWGWEALERGWAMGAGRVRGVGGCLRE